MPDGLSPHGLRKATCRRLAEAGCSADEIMAISGHQTLAEVTHYTVAANRVRLAERAVAAMERKEARTQTVKPTLKFYKFAP
ncbi:MAG: tyrosine-type recombinase/integrase [Tabrizicola sp.]|uniref:tyrosine-type recombinase/integrase n=1 Tax=Tabrizicola sp. TaxID=2005166 RepID=UPI0027354E5A|nr:tyrosine-type recombinase/integrase [Tabrizicola sp.]MDP3262926.1 tyrosine-type recombinase/integrase [Tabrizicola sp.]MDP3649123.1 tyrosine-type recombinase/integrase [Paracoccaceae bacterium]MDZ4065650.1 tyrosine-type recombinase/integrase [Tabrizicola sp.]